MRASISTWRGATSISCTSRRKACKRVATSVTKTLLLRSSTTTLPRFESMVWSLLLRKSKISLALW